MFKGALNSPSQLYHLTSASEVGHAVSLALPYPEHQAALVLEAASEVGHAVSLALPHPEHQAAQRPAGLVLEVASYHTSHDQPFSGRWFHGFPIRDWDHLRLGLLIEVLRGWCDYLVCVPGLDGTVTMLEKM
jgi:hypothetical protein